MPANARRRSWKSELPFVKEIWPSLPVETLTTLSINMYRTGLRSGSYQDDLLPRRGLYPLRRFVNLRELSLSGMVDSYQKMIWEAVWSIPGLKKLELKMVLEPILRRKHVHEWPFIEDEWRPRDLDDVMKRYR